MIERKPAIRCDWSAYPPAAARLDQDSRLPRSVRTRSIRAECLARPWQPDGRRDRRMTSDVEQVLSLPARSFADWLESHRAAFA